ncbi:MAG: carcinine hydrolase/isopenicillin-N N-acyltransferase family protein [Polyangiales bacterium]
MCDTLVLVPEAGPVWFAKNSDREPSEAQFLECHDGPTVGSPPRGLPDIPSDTRLVLSRPAWMWGCEMGVNAHGLAIGNEAVFTRLPVPKEGYTGMDFQRVALTRCRTADDALEQLIELAQRFPQGGAMGHRHRSFRYHSSFLIADPTTAWIFETAGELWAAKRVRGIATISNALTIEDDFDRVHDGAYRTARDRGWVKSASGFRFAGAFSDPVISLLAGASTRRACTARSLSGIREAQPRDFVQALSDHGATKPEKGLRSEAPCAHASWLPTRTSAQTTGSIIARLDRSGPTVWGTGTSSPCLSVFKPAPFDPEILPPRPIADARFDERELWWAHERLHRVCLADYHGRRVTFAGDRERLQDECLEPSADPRRAWHEHRSRIDEWLICALAVTASRVPRLTRWFWTRQSRAVSMPG